MSDYPLIRATREKILTQVLKNGQRAISTDTFDEFVGDGVTPGGKMAQGDVVYGTTAELTGKVFQDRTIVVNTATRGIFVADGVTAFENLPASSLSLGEVDSRVALYKPVANDTATREGRTPAQRELVYDTDLDQLFVGDGATMGGLPIGSGTGGGLVSVAASSTGNIANLASITNTNANDTDGATLVDGQKLLVANQDVSSENGVYDFNAGALTRSAGFDASDAFAGTSVIIFVRGGDTLQDQMFHTDNSAAFALDTTAMVWEAYNEFTIDNVTGLTSALASKEPSFTKNSAFNKNFGTSTGDVAEGDDARITGALQSSNDLSDLSNASSARNNLGLGDAAERLASDFLQTSNDLSDLSSASSARNNLSLGDSATKNTGTSAGEVAAGDDSRFPTSDEKAGLAANSPTAANPVITQGDTSTTPTADKVPKADGSGNLDPSWLALLSAFNGNSQLVQLDSGGKMPALDGNALTNIDASGPVQAALRGTELPHLGAYPNQPFNAIDNTDLSAFTLVKDGNFYIIKATGALTAALGLAVVSDDGEPDLEVELLDGSRISAASLDTDKKTLSGLPYRQEFQNPSLGAYAAPVMFDGGTF